jgi:hypothetical protein
MTHRGHFVGELFSRPTTPRSKGDAAMEPWVPGRSCTAGGLDAAMESRVPSISSGARHSDYHQVRAVSCESPDENGMAWPVNVINDDANAAQAREK